MVNINSVYCYICQFNLTLIELCQPNPSRQQVLHHPLFNLLIFGEFGFHGSDFGVHVGEDGGDAGLF